MEAPLGVCAALDHGCAARVLSSSGFGSREEGYHCSRPSCMCKNLFCLLAGDHFFPRNQLATKIKHALFK